MLGATGNGVGEAGCEMAGTRRGRGRERWREKSLSACMRLSAYHLPMRVLRLLLPVHLSVRHHCSGVAMRRWLLLLGAVRSRLLGASRVTLGPELHERHDSRDEIDRLGLGA